MKIKHTAADGATTEVDTGGDARTAKASWDGETISTQLVKAEPERRYTLNLIYPADKADVAVALDGHRDFAAKAAVQDAAWNFMANHRKVGTYHTAYTGEGQTDGAAEMVESFLWPDGAPDWEVRDGVTVKSGDWLGGFIWTPEAWADIKDGKINGISPEGTVKRRQPSAAAVEGLRP